jgi:membrane-bound hydrogenase subunit beta
MSAEEKIKQELLAKFKSLTDDKIRIQRARRIFADVALADFFSVLDYLVKEQKFNQLSAVTGMDEIDKITLIYHLAQETGIVFNLKVSIARLNPVMKTVSAYFPSGDIYEREIMDLLGVKFEGLPEGRRYPLPDDWPAGQHPLLKDWDPSILDKK